MSDPSGRIATFTSVSQELPLEVSEQEAIANYDYEQARFIVASRQKLRDENIAEATRHYEQELEEYNRKFSEILSKKKARNQEAYERDLEDAKQRLRKQIAELEAIQKNELNALQKRWQEARSYQQKQICQTVETLLSSSQLLAKAHRFDEAISMRNKAQMTQKRVRHPSIDEIDEDYGGQFKQALARHEQAFQELIKQHEAFKVLLSERQKAADETAQSEDNIEAAYASVEIMDTALFDEKNPDVTLPVLKHFSPRRRCVQSLIERKTGKRQGK
jgi:DNA repair exonuclease SbcCD ATPase subunit